MSYNKHNYSEEEWLLQLSNGSEEAFHFLYQTYAPKVFSLALLYLKSNDAAQDAVQEVFLKVWSRRNELAVIKNFGGWLRHVTRNHVIDALRRKMLQDELTENILPVSEETEEGLSAKEMKRLIDEAIQNLSPRQREVYLLAREEGLKHAEIGERLGLSTETVKEHMKQALRQLRLQLKDHLGVFLICSCHLHFLMSHSNFV